MVKNIAISLFLVAIGMKATGETSEIPRVYEEGKVWTYLTHFPHSPEKDCYFEESVDGDTIINDVVAIKIRRKFANPIMEDYVYAVYEKEGVVYAYYDGWEEFRPKINFNLTTGDKGSRFVNESISDELAVGNDERVEINGRNLRILTINDGEGGLLGYWVEGIGVVSNLEQASMIFYPITSDGYETRLIKCEKDGACIFSEEDLMKYSGVDAVYDDRRKDGIIYDLNGQQVKWPVKGQIYIKDGEKFVM